MKQNLTELKGEIENLTITVEDFNSSFLGVELADKSPRVQNAWTIPSTT